MSNNYFALGEPDRSHTIFKKLKKWIFVTFTSLMLTLALTVGMPFLNYKLHSAVHVQYPQVNNLTPTPSAVTKKGTYGSTSLNPIKQANSSIAQNPKQITQGVPNPTGTPSSSTNNPTPTPTQIAQGGVPNPTPTVSSGTNDPSPTPTATIAPIASPTPTATIAPIAPPEPTATIAPISTVTPTPTAIPTATPSPVSTLTARVNPICVTSHISDLTPSEADKQAAISTRLNSSHVF